MRSGQRSGQLAHVSNGNWRCASQGYRDTLAPIGFNQA